MKAIRVLIAEDSPVAQEFLQHIFKSDSCFEVVGTASNGAEAVEAVGRLRPSIVTMDINMPVMDGLEATRRIMSSTPTPIVVVSGNSIMEEVAFTFQAMEAGALAVVLRPAGFGSADFRTTASELIKTVKLMSEIKVIRRNRCGQDDHVSGLLSPGNGLPHQERDIRIVAIGASTGGPMVLKEILSGMPHDFALPILVVQHIASGFVTGFAQWLSIATCFPIHVASHGDSLIPGHVYLAPDDHHLGVSSFMRICLDQEAPANNGLRPSVAHLFRSVSAEFGTNAMGILLTGMGHDGARELKAMKDAGAITIAQDEKSCIVFGMPGEAVKLDAATCVLSPAKIAERLSLLSSAVKERLHDER
ncbi:MAG: chemotaxis response regulator protein-glutamate methylesterase [Spirochaetae bacterium HGW-Spirochaetae-7]|jgi:two-component system chemotaxis response regulator CheB|nr:MAG: chemotaxis response regulator protein-glutamate methylesterase [Spirochaetae bacterium HGW-Spirochaetae-7]